MAEIVLKPAPQSFPIGATVKVFAKPTPGGPLTGQPSGSILSEPVVAADGSLTVTGLTEGNWYVGYAATGGVDRYLTFQAEASTAAGPWTAFESLGTGVEAAAGQTPRVRQEQSGARAQARGALTLAAGKSLTAGSTLATLPPALRPPATVTLSCIAAGASATMTITAAGVVTLSVTVSEAKIVYLDSLDWNLT